MSWLSVFFKKDTVQAVLKAGLLILKQFIGDVAPQLQILAQNTVTVIQNKWGENKTGPEKRQLAFDSIKAALPEIENVLINHAIETAVLALLAQKR